METVKTRADHRAIVGESDECKRLRDAIEKVAGDRERPSKTSAACTA
jgi:hypothetical protein